MLKRKFFKITEKKMHKRSLSRGLPEGHTVDSRYLEFQETVKYFEISVHRHIRFAELRKQSIDQPYLTNVYVI